MHHEDHSRIILLTVFHKINLFKHEKDSGYRLGYCFSGGVAWGRGNRWSSTDFSVMHHLLQFNASCNSNSVLYNGRMKLSTACNSPHPLTPPSTLPHNLTPPPRPSSNLPSPSPWIMFWLEGYCMSSETAHILLGNHLLQLLQ